MIEIIKSQADKKYIKFYNKLFYYSYQSKFKKKYKYITYYKITLNNLINFSNYIYI